MDSEWAAEGAKPPAEVHGGIFLYLTDAAATRPASTKAPSVPTPRVVAACAPPVLIARGPAP